MKILEDKKTGKTRIVARGPTGNVFLNAGLIKGATYKIADGAKQLMILKGEENGGVSKWMIRVGKTEDMKTISDLLEEKKAN